MVQNKRGITAEDFYRIRYASDPQLSPDGTAVAYVQSMVDDDRAYRTHLFVQSLAEKSVIALTEGAVRDSSPRWSPDGTQICFISKRSGISQIWLIDAKGGEPTQVTRCKTGAANPVWSPDGKRIAFSSMMTPEDSFADLEMDEKKEAPKKAIVVNRMKYKSDDLGFVYDTSKQIAVLDVETGEITPVTHGEYHHTVGTWSPDGHWLAITANQVENTDLQHSIDVYLVPVNGGEWIKLTRSKGTFFFPTWSADGKKLAYIGSESPTQLIATQKNIWVSDLETGTQTCLTTDWDVQVGDSTIGDVRSPGHPNPGGVWTEDGSGMYFIASERGNSCLYHATLDGTITKVIGGERNIYGFTLHEQSRTAVIAVSDPITPGDLIEVNLETGEEVRLTEVNNELLSELDLPEPIELEYEGQDGWKLHGWLLKPVGFQEGEKYPMVLQIHGGPHSMYGNTFFHEFLLLAAKGYAVLYTNPRGSFGYGEKFMQACCGDYGGNDYLDLMSAVKYACDQFDFIDTNRMGVAGGSYGGFMTNWIVGQTNLFKAAVTDRSICNWLSFYGVSDIGYYFSAEEIQGNPFTNPEKLWQHSPIRHVANIETPLLIMHGEQDHRCPIEQAEQLYIALQHQGKAPVSFIRFPGASHELSRSGDPEQRVLRLQYTAEWFDAYLHTTEKVVME
ncbi:S9 family peptidase [Brevibacillus choshinensis]|uniref:S9 family peptidase n=1 Tax=Brevibacillus choshinensis TaxID=54911 RepID=UPI002E1EBC54|nr:S9 family peptidase [Brevibacillus choshinensis]